MTIDWKVIPDEPTKAAPFDGEPVLLWTDIATVEIVRLGWWNPGGIVDHSTGEIIEPAPEDLGWWSYIHSVTSEQLVGMYTPTRWAPYQSPVD